MSNNTKILYNKIVSVMTIVCTNLYKYRKIIFMILVILAVISSALSQIYPTVYFVPINGNFQNYNVVRRLLDGQIPYKDFAVYLGPMHLYLGAFFTWIFGGNFASSVFAYNFLTSITTIVFIMVLGNILKYSYEKICCAILIIFLIVSVSSPYDIVSYLMHTLNSSRFLRALPLFLSCLFILLIEKKVSNEKLKDFLYGITAGVAFPCSNDFGIATFLAVSISLLIVKIFERHSWKNIVTAGCTYFLGFLSSVLLSVLIYSKGHIIEWYQTTFGQGSYQSWYFLSIGEKVCHIYDFNFSFNMLMLFIFTGFVLYKLYCSIKNKTENYNKIKYLILFLLSFASFSVAQELYFLSDKNSYIPTLIFYVTIIFYTLSGIINFLKDYKINNCIKYSFAILLCAFSLFGIIHNLALCCKKTDIKKIDNLGSRLSDYTDSVQKAKQYIGKNKIFSTYSSALEVVTNQYQPTGYDYIIHVLGDKARENYLKVFRNRDFKYVTTQHVYYSTDTWEYWIQNANWFFYRELYRYYKPVYSNEYMNFFTLSENEDYNNLPKNTQITYTSEHKNRGKIILKTDSSINGIADLDIDFDIAKTNIFSKIFIYRTLLRIIYQDLFYEFHRSVWDCKTNVIYLPNNRYTIGIPIINGYGELYISSEPLHNVKLNIKNLKLGKYYKTPFKYLHILQTKDDVITIYNCQYNRMMLLNVNKIKISDNEYNIIDIKENYDPISISIKVDKIIKKNNGLIELIR